MSTNRPLVFPDAWMERGVSVDHDSHGDTVLALHTSADVIDPFLTFDPPVAANLGQRLVQLAGPTAVESIGFALLETLPADRLWEAADALARIALDKLNTPTTTGEPS